jgi:hypothetical protein
MLIELNVLELGSDKNPFEILASKIEEWKLKYRSITKIEDSAIKNAEEIVLDLERRYQDLVDVDIDRAKMLIQAVHANLLILEADKDFSIKSIEGNLQGIRAVAEGVNLNRLDPKRYILSEIFHAENKQSVSPFELSRAIEKTFLAANPLSDLSLELVIDFIFDIPHSDAHKPLEFIYMFIEVLNKVPGVHLSLEEVKVGSLQAKIKAIFDDVTSKEEVKDILDSAIKLGKAKLGKDYAEMQKIEAETRKVEMESDLLSEKLNEVQSEETKQLKRLETESITYDVERKRMENELLKMRVYKEKKEIIKELLSDGFIDQRQMEMLIQGIPFLRYENGQLLAGNNNVD